MFGFTAGYVVSAWVAVEVASVVLPAFDAPKQVLQFLIVGVVALAPAAMVLAWFYDFTRHGVVNTDEEDRRRARVAAPAPETVASAPEADAAPTNREASAGAAAPGQPERRLVTVLQCSVTLRVGDEDELQQERFRSMTPQLAARFREIVTGVEGYLLPTEREVFTAYFGVQTAHEDDALRAVLSAQRMLQHVAACNAEGTGGQPVLRASAGLHCAHAIVEELPGQPVERWVSNVGHAQNLAAALQLAAPDGEIRLSHDVRALLHERIACEPAGEMTLPGLAKPATVYRAAATANVVPGGSAGCQDMVGRDRELALLEERWQATEAAQGSTVLVRGEAGVGKSRLVAAFRERVEAGSDAAVIALQCSAHFAHSPLHPVLTLVAQAASGEGATTLPTASELATWLGARGATDPDLPRLFREVMTREVRADASQLEPGKQKERLLQALVDVLTHAAKLRRVLLLVEDLHWADPTTIELLELLGGEMPSSRALLLLTARPGLQVPWLARSDVHVVSVGRLDATQSRALVAALDRDGVIAPSLAATIVARADGVPLFLEELTRSVVEGANEHRRDDAPTTITIPNTLQESLAARIHRLGPAKPLLQLAATVGREFPPTLLRACSDLPSALVDAMLDQLVTRDLVYRRGTGAQLRYVFRHALIQEAAYASMLKSRREECHLQVARAMEQDAVLVARETEQLAHHYANAPATPAHRRSAIDYWLAAAQVALRRSANAEARHFLEGALRQLAHLPADSARDALELRIQAMRIPMLVALHGYSSEPMAQASRRALELCESAGDFDLRFMALFSVCIFDMVGGRHRDSHHTALRLVRLDEENGATLAVESRMLLGLTHFFLGQLAEAERELRASLAAHDPEAHASHAYRFGQDPEVVAACYLSWVLFCRGEDEHQAAAERRALDAARRLGHPNSLGFALAWAGWVRAFRGEFEGVEHFTTDLAKVAGEYGLNSFAVQAQLLDALRMCSLGRHEAALPALEQGLEVWRNIGSRCFQVCWDVLCARACLGAGETLRAGEVLERAEAALRVTEERWSEPDLHRCRGELEHALGRGDRAAAAFLRARECAAETGAAGWQRLIERSTAGSGT